MLEIAHQPGFQPLKDQAVCPFRLPIRLRVRNGCVVDPSALGCAKHSELIRIKVGAIICDNAVRDSISEYQLSDETDGSARIKIFDRLGFDPFGEFVDRHKQMSETTSAGLERSNHVQPPDCKWPDEWDSLQGRCMIVRHV